MAARAASTTSERQGGTMGQITELIDQGRDGGVDNAALFGAAYDELKRLARARLSRSGPMTLLDSTALVNEIWLKLANQRRLQVDTRRRFFAYAAEVMRNVIVDQIRERHALRRGGGERHLTLDTALGDGLADDDEALQVHEALDSLAQLEPRLAQVVEMRYFGGMTEVEIGEALGVTERTVRRDWEKARLLLASMLE
jgi:RNA polymerase sigma factor (TIGR02999 family)